MREFLKIEKRRRRLLWRFYTARSIPERLDGEHGPKSGVLERKGSEENRWRNELQSSAAELNANGEREVKMK